MDHQLAVKSQACEKYLLGELSPELRDAYEEHYFSCTVCALQLREATELIAASKLILAENPQIAEPPGVISGSAPWWRPSWPWFRPSIAIPAFAALLLFVGYQNFVTIPRLQQSASPRVLPMYSLISANTRGDQGLVFSVAAGEPFGLYVDVPADPAFSTYLLRLEDPSGASSPLRSLTALEAQKTQVVTVQPGKRSGKFTLVISGLTAPGADASSAKELARLQFSVEMKN